MKKAEPCLLLPFISKFINHLLTNLNIINNTYIIQIIIAPPSSALNLSGYYGVIIVTSSTYQPAIT
jgi:hypothetical protein